MTRLETQLLNLREHQAMKRMRITEIPNHIYEEKQIGDDETIVSLIVAF